jgi:hypothetical protein
MIANKVLDSLLLRHIYGRGSTLYTLGTRKQRDDGD